MENEVEYQATTAKPLVSVMRMTFQLGKKIEEDEERNQNNQR